MALFAYICDHCGKQSHGPQGHRVGGDDLCTSCLVGARFSRRDGISPQPRLRRIEVAPVDPADATKLEVAAARRREAWDDLQESFGRRVK